MKIFKYGERVRLAKNCYHKGQIGTIIKEHPPSIVQQYLSYTVRLDKLVGNKPVDVTYIDSAFIGLEDKLCNPAYDKMIPFGKNECTECDNTWKYRGTTPICKRI